MNFNNSTNFLESIAVSRSTLANYASTIKTFEASLTSYDNIDIALKSHLANYKPSTAALKFSILRRYIKFTYKIDVKTRTRTRAKAKNESYSFQEAELLINSTKNKDLADLMTLLIETGLRTGEALALKVGDIKGEVLNINKTARQYGDFKGTKTGLDRDIYISERARAILKARIDRKNLRDNDYIWSTRGGKPYKNTKRWSSAIKIASKKCGIDAKRLYTLRHAYASKFINMDINNIKVVSYQLGHTSVRTTLAYYYNNDTTPDAVKNMMQGA